MNRRASRRPRAPRVTLLILAGIAGLAIGCTPRKASEKAAENNATETGAPAASARAAELPAPAEDPSAAPPSEGPRADREPPPSEQTLERPPFVAEAKRKRIKRIEDDPELAAHKQTLTDHFGDHLGAMPTPLDVQSIPLAGDREASLITAPAPDRHPFILVTDRQGTLLWTKDLPLAGIAPNITELAMTTGPEGDVVLSWFDTPTRIVALRRWDSKGGILADFQLLELGPCDAISVLYWPGYGWLAAAAQLGSARIQRLGEGARLAWGPDGKSLPWASKPDAPVAIARDTDDSAILLQVGYARGPAGSAPGHLLAYRIDAEGTALWPRPVDLGLAPPIPRGARIVATRTSPGEVRAVVGGSASGWKVEVSSQGTVRR